MRLNENSPKEDFLEYIKNHSFEFLYFFSNKSWAEPYFDEAVKKVVEKRSLDFIKYFSDKPWAYLYIDDVMKEVIRVNPKYFLENFGNRFPQYIRLALSSLENEKALHQINNL